MSHKPNRLDIITDLRRSISASFSKKAFADENAKTFLKNAERNLKEISLDKNTSLLVEARLKKAKDPKQPTEKRREDLLMVSSLV